MAEPDRQALLTMLTTEHFTLQGSRATTVSETSSRATLYMGAVSSTLIALGFIAQISNVGDAFDIFALTVLPTVYALGVFTFVRTVESSVEDILYGRAINRIRAYYLELAGPESRWFVLGGHDDALGVLANMGIRPDALAALLHRVEHGRDREQRGGRERGGAGGGASTGRAAGRGGRGRRAGRDRLVRDAPALGPADARARAAATTTCCSPRPSSSRPRP